MVRARVEIPRYSLEGLGSTADLAPYQQLRLNPMAESMELIYEAGDSKVKVKVEELEFYVMLPDLIKAVKLLEGISKV